MSAAPLLSKEGRRPRLVVVGSLNMDLVVRLSRLPQTGETLAGRDLQAIPGGKGANQAVAAVRLGADTIMIGRVGNDSFGPALLAALQADGVNTSQVRVTDDCSSGVAIIHVEESGQNCITIVAGANGRLAPGDVKASEEQIQQANAMLVQLEIPIETVTAALNVARQHGVRTILDPAPAPRGAMPEACYDVDVLSPNQTEAEALTGHSVTNAREAERACRVLREHGARNVVLKMGAAGAIVCDAQDRITTVPTSPVQVVDTTAAGDAFTAALGVGLCLDLPLIEAVRTGCAAGTLATTRFGAQPAMPTREDVAAFLVQMEQTQSRNL